MSELEYIRFDDVNPEELRIMLNKQKIREHLIDHNVFDSNTVKTWIQGKIEVDSTSGCRVRVIICNNSVAGWCGIQFEEGTYELAIVLDNQHWGMGRQVFNEIMRWAKELGHNEVCIHLLHTRPEYKFLRMISKNVFETELHGNKFKTYQLSVN